MNVVFTFMKDGKATDVEIRTQMISKTGLQSEIMERVLEKKQDGENYDGNPAAIAEYVLEDMLGDKLISAYEPVVKDNITIEL